MAKETYYFSHDYNARNDPKLQKVLMKLGHAGKGVFWDLIEMLYEQDGYLELSECENYAFALRTDINCITSLINDFELFKKDASKFWSESVLKRLDRRNEKSQKASNSAKKRWENANALNSDANALRQEYEGNAIKERKGNKRKEKENKEKEKKDISRMLFATGSETDLFIPLKEIFLNFYKEKCGDGEYYFQAIDGAKLKSILKKLFFKMKEKSSGQKESFTGQEVSEAMLFLLTKGYATADDWTKANFTLQTIDNKFNSIFTAIKNEGTNKRNGNHVSNDDVLAAVHNLVNVGG